MARLEEQGGDTRDDGSRLQRLLRRSSDRFRANLQANRRLLKNRRATRPAIPRIHGWRYLLIVAVAVVMAAIVLDQPIGAYRSQWPPEVLLWAGRLTDIGKSGWILIPTGAFLVVGYALDWQWFSARARLRLAKWMSAAAYVFLSVGVSGLIVAILKRLIGRARPKHFEEWGAYSFQPFSDYSWASFPSGHSTTAGALFAAIAIFFPALRIPALILGIWLGFTRVLVGAHYPSDVIAGLAFGAWYAYFTALVFARYGFIFTYDAAGWPVRRRGTELLRLWRKRPRP